MSVTVIVQRYLENVELMFHPWEIVIEKSARLRPVFRDEKDRLNRDFFADFDTACVVEALESPPPDGLDKADLRVRSVFNALLLYEDRLIRSRRIISGASSLITFDPIKDIARMVHGSEPSWRHVLSSAHIFPLKIDSKSKADKFSKFCETFLSLTKPAYFQMAMDRFSYATDMIAAKSQWPHRLIEYVTSLEALLTRDEPEVSYKLPMRVVSLLDGSKDTRAFTFEFLRKSYAVRSKLVHGAEAKELRKILPIKIEKKSFDASECLDALHTLCRDCLRSVFGHLCGAGVDSNKESLVKMLDHRLVTR